jgi:phosphoglycerate dehydrogenase-like enzyme
LNVLITPGLTLPEPSATDLERIRHAAGPGCRVTVCDAAKAHEHAADAEAILGFISPKLLAAAPKLKWVHAIASGVDTFLFPAFRASPVVLTSEKGLVGEHLADHAFGLLLMLTRQLATSLRLGADAWNHRPEMRAQEVELTGLKLGCVGFGGTGRAIAKRAAAFGMTCRAVDPEPVPVTAEVQRVEETQAFASLLADSDVVAVCCPLTQDTRNLFDRDAFARMKRSAYLVNVTRGEVMDEAALVHALQSGQIRGAALDVAPREPLPADSPLWRMPNVVMTPHTAGASQFRAARNLDRFITNLERLRLGAPLEGLIDKEKGY